MKTSLLIIWFIPLLGGLVCYGLLMVDGPKEEDEGLFCKEINTEEGKNPMTVFASYQEQYREEKIMFQKRVEPFGFGTSFKATTNPLIESSQTANVADPTNLDVLFITETSKKD